MNIKKKKIWIILNNTRDTNRNHVKIGVIDAISPNEI